MDLAQFGRRQQRLRVALVADHLVLQAEFLQQPDHAVGAGIFQMMQLDHGRAVVGGRTIVNTPSVKPVHMAETGRQYTQELPMAKPNYAFEKRQREIAKKKKKEEKLARKQSSRPDDSAPEDNADTPSDNTENATDSSPQG